jgi:1-acyl-sn-glycerol-3-phosphate acyltransferase
VFRKKTLDEWALDYWMLQQYARLCFSIYYRKVEILNLDKIPRNQPVILAPNHQNALMDAMLLVCKTPFQNVFLARADIFKGKRLIRFLTYLNIMPIYRIRDGFENVRRNDEVFDKTIQVLHNRHNPLVIFPEGSHGDKRRLRSLVKGLFRIAFQAQERYGKEPYVKIIPVGYDYGHYQHFRTTLFVSVGDPIEISDYMGMYQENPVLALNMIKESFAAALSKLMIDIQTTEYYELYMHLREIFNKEMRIKLGIQKKTLAERFRADKYMIKCLNAELKARPENISQLDNIVKQYTEGLKEVNLRDWVIAIKKQPVASLVLKTFGQVILSPLFAFGFINNFIPYIFTEGRTKNLKDPQFFSSFKYVIGMIIFPIWYLIIAGLLALTRLPVWSILIYIIALPVAGLLAFHYFIGLKKLSARWRYYFGRNNAKIRSVFEFRNEILNRTHAIIDQYNADNENSR